MATAKAKEPNVTSHVLFNNAFEKVLSTNKCHSEKMLPWGSPSISKAWQPSSIRKASTTHGDLSNLRPKSPPLMVFMTPNSGIRHVPRYGYFDKSSDLPVFPETPSIKPRLQRLRKELIKTPTYDSNAKLISYRTRSPRKIESSIAGSPLQTRCILTGLDCAYESPVALYKPRVQLPELQFPLYIGDPQGLSSLRNSHTIEQLDNYTVWTQLSFETAEILYEIDRLVTSCTEDLLAEKLAHLDMATSKPAANVYTTVEGIIRNLYLLSFNVSELMDIVFERMRLDYYHHTSTYSPELLRELFLLYLLSRNNIDKKTADGKTYGTMTLGLQPSGGVHAPHSRAEVVQRSDILLFPCLDILPREGSMVEIRPRYHRGVFDERNDDYYSDVSYSIVDLPPWLHWDDKILGWTGWVPMYSELRGMSTPGRQIINGGRDGPYAVLHLLRLEVKATLIVRHSSLSIGLKRTVRTRLTLKVVPWYAAKRPQTPLSSWQHEHCTQNDSAAVDSKFQDYLAKCQKTLESPAGESLGNQSYGSRIIDEIDCNIIFRPDLRNARDLTTISDWGSLCNMDSGCRTDEHFLHHPGHVHPPRVGEHSKPHRVQDFHGSSATGSAYELQEYPASDSALSSNSVQSQHRQGDHQLHKCKSATRTSENCSRNNDYHTRDWQGRNSTSDGSNSKYELTESEPDIFNLHKRDMRDDTLQYASPELYQMAQVLHQPELQVHGAQRSAVTQGEHYAPSEISGYSISSNTATADSENQQDGKGGVRLSGTEEETEDTKSQSLSPSLTPYITCLINRFAPLRELRTNSSNSGVTSSSLSSDREALETRFAVPYAACRDQEASDEEAEAVRTEDYHRFDSGCYLADHQAGNDNIDVTDSISQRGLGTKAEDTEPSRIRVLAELKSKSTRSNSDRSMSSDASIQQTVSPQETPKLGPMVRQFSPTELLPCPAMAGERSPPAYTQSQKSTGPWQMESFDEIAANPFIRQEQALLWRVLTNKENIDAAQKKDPKLEAEVLKGLWEVLRYEAKQQQRNGVSEETLGVDSGQEWSMSESGEEKESASSSGSEGRDGEAEDTWNFAR
ncbi:hypothetical protein MMC26_005219 [Xylographa opegraphella]|nr:hypothetical protein [Xylographa opegraphella]